MRISDLQFEILDFQCASDEIFNCVFLEFSGIQKHISVLRGREVLLGTLSSVTVSIKQISLRNFKTENRVICTVAIVLCMQRSKKKDFQSYIYTCMYISL